MCRFARVFILVVISSVLEYLDIPPSAVTWPTSAFAVVVSACLILFGRIADIYRGFPVYIDGIAWLAIMALAVRFSQIEIMLDVWSSLVRAWPCCEFASRTTLLGNMYRPGPR